MAWGGAEWGGSGGRAGARAPRSARAHGAHPRPSLPQPPSLSCLDSGGLDVGQAPLPNRIRHRARVGRAHGVPRWQSPLQRRKRAGRRRVGRILGQDGPDLGAGRGWEAGGRVGGGRGGGGPDVAGQAVMRREAPAPDAGRRRRQALEAGATVVDAAAAPYQPGDIPTTTTQAVPEGDAFAAVWIGADPVASAAARGVVAVGGRQGGEVHAASSTSPRTPATWPLPTNVTRPADDAALAFLPVLHLAALLRARTLTSTELTEVYLERLARWAGVGGFGVWGACAGWTGRCGLGGRGRLGRRGAGRACRRPPGAQTALTPPRAPQPSCSCPTTGPAPTLGPTHPAEHGGAGLACRVSVPTLPAPGHPRYHHPPSLLPFTNPSATPPPPIPASYLPIRRNAGGGGNADARPGARPGSGCRRRAGRGRVAGPPARHPVRPEGCHLPGWLPHDVGRRPLARPRGGGERRCRAPPGRRRRGARGQAGHRGAGV